MIGKVIIFVFLFTCWYVFSGENGAFYLVSGEFSSALVVYIAARMDLIRRLDLNINVFPYWFWLIGQVIKGTIDVMQRVWGLKPVTPSFVQVDITQDNDLGYTVYGNSATLTPGTVTVDIDPKRKKILFHAISTEGVSDMKSGEMDRRVKKVITDWKELN